MLVWYMYMYVVSTEQNLSLTNTVLLPGPKEGVRELQGVLGTPEEEERRRETAT